MKTFCMIILNYFKIMESLDDWTTQCGMNTIIHIYQLHQNHPNICHICQEATYYYLEYIKQMQEKIYQIDIIKFICNKFSDLEKDTSEYVHLEYITNIFLFRTKMTNSERIKLVEKYLLKFLSKFISKNDTNLLEFENAQKNFTYKEYIKYIKLIKNF